jgi:hypothetical protein
MHYGLFKYKIKADIFAQIVEVSKENSVPKQESPMIVSCHMICLVGDNTNPMMF